MGEAKAKAVQDQSAVMGMLSVPVSEKDILQGATCFALLGDFFPQRGPIPGTEPLEMFPPAEDQLRIYWSYMRKAIPVARVPIVWNRIRALTEAMAKNPDILALFGGEETGEGVVLFDPQGDLFLRICSTMPVMPNKEGARSLTCNVFCPHDVIISLAAGPT